MVMQEGILLVAFMPEPGMCLIVPSDEVLDLVFKVLDGAGKARNGAVKAEQGFQKGCEQADKGGENGNDCPFHHGRYTSSSFQLETRSSSSCQVGRALSISCHEL